MKRLFALIVASGIFLTISLLISRRLGEDAHPIAFAAVFTNPDGSRCEMPCMFGIRPGVSTVENAEQILKSHPLLKPWTVDRNRDGSLEISNYFLFLRIYVSPGKKVGAIVFYDPFATFSSSNSSPLSPLDNATLGSVVALLGAPDAVLVEEATQLSYVRYKTTVSFSNDDYEMPNASNYLTPVDKFIGITMETSSTPEVNYPFTDWLGFAARAKYSTYRLNKLLCEEDVSC
jgi:hypothetical protein